MPDDPKPTLPTHQELKQLPLWALVAYAARCARRSHPIYARALSEMRKDQSYRQEDDLVNRVLDIAEMGARTGHRYSEPGISEAISGFAFYHSNQRRGSLGITPEGEHRLRSEISAGIAASAAFHIALSKPHSLDAAFRAGAESGNAIAYLSTTSSQADRAARADFEVLRAMAERERWTDDTPVDVKILGPLWPDGGEPGWWPKTERDKRRIKLDIAIPAGMSDEDAQQLIRRVVLAMSKRHQELGGSGLVLDDKRVHIEAPCGVPAGGVE